MRRVNPEIVEICLAFVSVSFLPNPAEQLSVSLALSSSLRDKKKGKRRKEEGKRSDLALLDPLDRMQQHARKTHSATYDRLFSIPVI